MTGYSLNYVLDKLSFDQVILFHNYGMDFEETKAIILINKLSEAMGGKKGKNSKKNIKTGDKPDLKKFNSLYGNKIKRPNGK